MTLADGTHAVLQDPAFAALKHFLIQSTGLAYYADKNADLASRISARLAHLGLSGCAAYLALLREPDDGETERHVLIGQLTIGETYFFRHAEQIDAIRDVALADIIERNRGSRTLRIWSAGAATGAEAYTLAIVLKQHFGAQLDGWDVRILATDLNQGFLARAERGIFDERALRTTPEAVRRAWFTETRGAWTIVPSLKPWLTFQYHNLVEHPFPSLVHGIAAMDLIVCRNVMIYFDWPVINRILGQFHACLVDGGWLAVGHAESNPEAFAAYRTVNAPGATLYQKTDRREEPVWVPPVAAMPAPAPFVLPAEPAPWTPPVLPAPAPRSVESPAPSRAPSPFDRVRRLADEGRWTEAAHACDQALHTDALNPALHFLHALVLEQMRRLPDAERSLRKAIYLDREFALAHYHLALLLKAAGRADAAAQSLRNVRTLASRMGDHAAIAHADGLTAGDLRQLAELQISTLTV